MTPPTDKSSNKVAINIIALYAKMGITIVISLVTTRVLLAELGVQDFGVFNLVGGVIALLSFVNATIVISTQRFLAYDLGLGNMHGLAQIFNSSLLINTALSFILILLLLLVGFWGFDGFFVIPEDRIDTAKRLYLIMVVTTLFTLLSTPYEAAINAQEDMVFLAIIYTLESLMKFAIALFLCTITTYDKLLVYGILLCATYLSTILIKIIYAVRKYPYVKIKLKLYNKKISGELLRFSSWNIFASMSTIFRQQGVNIILNLFYGTIANAAYGITTQVSNQVNYLATTILGAITPQIIKNEGRGDRDAMIAISIFSAKFTFSILTVVVVPICLNIHFLLALWLGEPPEYASEFSAIFLCSILLSQMTNAFQISIMAVGQIKQFQLSIGILQFLTLPLLYLFLYLGIDLILSFSVLLIIEILTTFARLYYARKVAGVDIYRYCSRVILPQIVVVGVGLLVLLSINYIISASIYRIVIQFILGVFIFLGLSWLILLSPSEKKTIVNLLIKVTKRIGITKRSSR